MKKNIFFLILATLLLFFPAISSSFESDGLIMGVFPRRNYKTTIKIFTPLAENLAAKIGTKVTLESTTDFANFWKNVQSRRYDIAHFNQYHYVKAHKLYGYQAILMNEELGSKTISGAIYVRKDSGINSIKDLKGKKIIFGGGSDAMVSFIVASSILKQGGLNKGDYDADFAINPPNAIMAVYFKQSAAAGSGNITMNLPVITKAIDASQLKMLAQSREIPHLPWAVKESLSPDVKDKIIKAFLSMNTPGQAQNALQAAKLSGLHPATDKDFDPHRNIIKEILDEEY